MSKRDVRSLSKWWKICEKSKRTFSVQLSAKLVFWWPIFPSQDYLHPLTFLQTTNRTPAVRPDGHYDP